MAGHSTGNQPRTAEREEPITSFGALVDRLTPEVDPRTGRRRAALVFRGCTRASTPLLTSLDKLGGANPPHQRVHLEAHLLRAYARYARPFIASSTNGWEILVSARHHGVPTRLLDWTGSVAVAAHFATVRPARGVPAVIWQLDWQQVHERFGLPPLALTLGDLAERFGADIPLGAASDTDNFLGDEPFLCLVEPPSLDARIIAQSAMLTLCSDTSRPLDQFLAAHGLSGALRRFVIPPEAVPVLRDQLDFLGVDERHLFPDLDGVAAAIRRYYG